MRNLTDVCLAFPYKQWWTFQSKHTLWGEFLKAKYCQRSNPLCKKWDNGDSLIWKHMVQNRYKVEQHIQWKINSGTCYFWQDKWLGVGPLALLSSHSNRFNNSTIAYFWEEGHQNWNKLMQQAPECQLSNILATTIPWMQQQRSDQAIWKLNNNGQFSCSISWNEIREKKNQGLVLTL